MVKLYQSVTDLTSYTREMDTNGGLIYSLREYKITFPDTESVENVETGDIIELNLHTDDDGGLTGGTIYAEIGYINNLDVYIR